MCVVITPEGLEEPSVDMANANAAAVLDVLGLPVDDMAGEEDAEAFLGRVLLALAVAPASAELPTFQEGNVVFGGRRAGYVQERLAQLRGLAETARALGLRVTWG